MTLQEWIDSVGGCRRAGLVLGVPISTVKTWRTMTRQPSPQNAGLIIDKSKGALDCNGIYGPFVEKAANEPERAA